MPRRRPPRLIVVASAILLAGVVGLWARSYLAHPRVDWGERIDTPYGWTLRGHSISARRGVAYHVRSYGPLVVPIGAGWSTYSFLGITLHRGCGTLVPDGDLAAYMVTTSLPLYWPALVLAVLPGWSLWFRHRANRRRASGRCQQCRYDLTANASGRCPECGADVAPAPTEVVAR